MTNKAPFCASLWITISVFCQLLYKAVSMALWTMAITCGKAGFNSRFCREHQAGKYKISVNPVILSNFSSCRSLSAVALAKAHVFCAFLWLKNQRNLRLINDLRSTKDYVRKNNLFMQNKANFQKVNMNVNKVLTKDYDRMDTWSIRKTKPIQSQFKANSKPIKANTKPIQTQFKPKQSQFQRQNMLNLKINTRPNSPGSYTGQIEHDSPALRIHAQRTKKCRITDEIEMNNRKNKTLMSFATILVLVWILTPSGNLHANPKSSDRGSRQTCLKGWNTNTEKRAIELNELISGGPGRDGIPAINKPKFLKPGKAQKCLKPETKIYTERQKATPSNISLVGRCFGTPDPGRKPDFVLCHKHNFQLSFRVFTPIKIR